MTTLRAIANDYEQAEITCLFVHDRKKNVMTNLMTVFELVPSEQQSSLLIGNKAANYMHRESIDDDHTLYITRLINLPINDALVMYENSQSGIHLKYDTLDVQVQIQGFIDSEPPDDNPLLISLGDEKTLGRILPKRNTSLRVWSKINTDKAWLQVLDKKFFGGISGLSRKYLGYDLSSIQEHIGNVYLCACNPILRNWRSSLLDLDKDLIVSFHERIGKSIVGCKLVVEEERAKRNGFTVTHTIRSNRERILLPYFPDTVHKKLYDQTGNLIECVYSCWRNFGIRMNIQERLMELTIHTPDGDEVLSIPKTSHVSTTTIGSYDLTNANYLRNALDARRFKELEKSKEFIFFPKDERSPAKARGVVKELLNKAHKRCIILDPYFGAQDLVFAATIQNISFSVQIISSASFLNQFLERDRKLKGSLVRLWQCVLNLLKKSKKRKTYAEQLDESLREWESKFPLQKIECRVLRGDKSPLHDRYIVVDEEAYLLGSSLNEFGARATTIIKVPTPQPLIDQALQWWDDDKTCPTLAAYLEQRGA